MILNVTDILTAEGKTETKTVRSDISVIVYGSQQYPVTGQSPVTLTISNTGEGKAQVTGTVELTVPFCCDRCLKEVPWLFSLQFSETVISPEAVASEEEDCIVGYQVDVDDLIRNEIFMNWPMKVLCRPDCKGICSICGKDLNEGTCGCDTFVPDPRLAAIRDILKEDKEVE